MASTTNKSLLFFITGCSSGFGYALARIAASSGHRVVATSRNPAKTPKLVSEIKSYPKCDWIAFDATWPADRINSTITEIQSQHGPIDVLINNAGYALFSTVEDMSESAARTQLDTNFFGPFNTIKAVLPTMRERKSGTIVNFSSIGGIRSLANSSLYGGSKFLFEGFSESLSQEVEPFNIRVLIVEPGAFRSDFLSSTNFQMTPTSEGYKGTMAATVMQKYKEMDGQQGGDVNKGAQRVYEVVMGEGMAKGKKWHLRLPLGEDCLQQARDHHKQVLENFDACEEIAKSTSLD